MTPARAGTTRRATRRRVSMSDDPRSRGDDVTDETVGGAIGG